MKSTYLIAIISVLIVAGAISLLAYYLFVSNGMPQDEASDNPPSTLNGVSLYSSECSSCHRDLSSTRLRGRNVEQIKNAIRVVSLMRPLSNLTDAQIEQIAQALSKP